MVIISKAYHAQNDCQNNKTKPYKETIELLLMSQCLQVEPIILH